MQQLCPWETAKYFLYSSNVPTLFFYSHIPAVIVALFFGFLVFYKTGKSKIGTTLLTITLLFSAWCVFDLILWATNSPGSVMFYWSLQVLFEPLIYLLCFYLLYLFIKNNDLPFRWKSLGILLYLPIVLLLSTKYNILGVNLADCTAAEGFIAHYFTYALETFYIVFIMLLVISEFHKNHDPVKKREILTFGLGVILFLVAFSWGNIIGSFSNNWNLAQAGLIGMPIFIGFLAYLIVRFHTFNIKLIATQALVWSLGILIGSQFFFIRTLINKILNSLTFMAAVILGYFLIRSVKREVQQKEELAKLNIDLQSSIKQRESLVHLVTHKVKGSFTRSKYIFAGILDGTFGDVNKEIKKIAGQGLESDNMGIETVDLVLNVDNLQKGIVKYEMKPVDLKELVVKSIEEKRGPLEAKGLQIETNIKNGIYSVLGDSFWLKEVVNNLVENSIKYTKQGKITVGLERHDDKVLLKVSDTGIGITEEDKKSLFTEGGRGKDAVRVNVDSTGYGLYSVKLIVEAHKGRVWGESLGPDKGSTFSIELPASII